MQSRQVGSRHFLVLKRGEDIAVEIQKYILEQQITAGSISGIGATDQVVLQYYDMKKKDYFSKEFEGEYEIASLIGNISVINGKAFPHLHIVIGDTEYRAFGGHLQSARVSITCEIIIDATDTEIGRILDEETGLKVWNLENT